MPCRIGDSIRRAGRNPSIHVGGEIVAIRKIGENDICEFYRTPRCEELEQEPEFIKKYGEGCHFILAKFRSYAPRRGTNDRYANEYIIYNKTGEPVGEMIEHSQEWQERQLQRVMGMMHNFPE